MFSTIFFNDQSSNRKFVKDDVPKGSVLGLLVFLIYINHLPQGLISDVKHFASFFTTVNCAKASSSSPNSIHMSDVT